jgi:DNA-binding NarL/FixJ family response regulator
MAKRLTLNEKSEILSMMAHGMTNWEIMEKTCRSLHTINRLATKYNMHDKRYNRAAMPSRKSMLDELEAIDTICNILMEV